MKTSFNLNNSVNQLKATPVVRRIVDSLPRKLKVRFRRILDRATRDWSHELIGMDGVPPISYYVS